MTTRVHDALNGAVLAPFFALSPEERLTTANVLLDQLRGVMTEVADARRTAVRDLRMAGYTLQEIADMVGTTAQRIHQIESGYNRKEKAARKRPVS